jgi:hypothetical protein
LDSEGASGPYQGQELLTLTRLEAGKIEGPFLF